MQDVGGRSVIDLKVNGKGPYRFVLDTGATTTVVSDELSRELSLTPPAGVQVASVGGGPAPSIVVIHDVRIRSAVLEGVIAAVMPLGSLLKGEKAPRGVLSAANFPSYLLTYDYPGKHISIKKGALESADFKSTFQYTEEQVLPTVPIRIAGHDMEVHLDTGSAFGLTQRGSGSAWAGTVAIAECVRPAVAAISCFAALAPSPGSRTTGDTQNT